MVKTIPLPDKELRRRYSGAGRIAANWPRHIINIDGKSYVVYSFEKRGDLTIWKLLRVIGFELEQYGDYKIKHDAEHREKNQILAMRRRGTDDLEYMILTREQLRVVCRPPEQLSLFSEGKP